MKKTLIYILTVFFFVNIVISQDFTCGNGFCDQNENYYSCEKDCASGHKDNFCDNVNEGRCDPDCIKTDPDCPDYKLETKKQESNPAWGYILGTASIITILGFLILLFKKIAGQKIEKDREIYNVDNINRYSNIKEQKQESNWTNQTDQEIVEDIKKDERYRQYFR
ncbi:hypothetical protein GF327_02210 [Candidatus Woesearchaeota archaeon]|nr:hypothetical protein [Candidatus Woesearchaeota archaeon]